MHCTIDFISADMVFPTIMDTKTQIKYLGPSEDIVTNK